MKWTKGLTYVGRLARNLLLLLLLGALLWGLLGFPAPTLLGRFRMAERANWS